MEVMTEGKVEGSAGRNQPNCRVEVAGGVASIGGRRIQLSKGVIALWHQDSSGTFHGFHDPERFKSRKEPAPITPEGVIQRSTSGGADVMAAVVKVPESGLLVVTSGTPRGGGRIMIRKIRNLTPHPVNILDVVGNTIVVFPSEGCVRLKAETRLLGVVEGIRLTKTVFGFPEGLPEKEAGVRIIVSQLVKSALPDRVDLVVPAEVMRDDNGNIIGCQSLGV